jgi:uncharacterized sulfatase
MNRRSFLKTAGAAGALSALPATSLAENKAKRQVIVILGESVRRDMLGCYRKTGLRTPNLDRLAAEGMRFEHAYNAQPVCGPARTCVWTGLYPHSSGMWGNSMEVGNIEHTIGQRLQDHGVHTALMGKWHLDGVDYFDTGIPQPGWDPKYWYDMRDYLSELTPEERELSRKPSTVDTIGWPQEKCYGYRVTNRAIDFLEHHGAEDFLLCVCFDEPHGPSLAPRHYSDSYADFVFPSDPNVHDTLVNKPVEQRIWAGERLDTPPKPIQNKLFFGSHTFVDDQIGRLLEQVQKSAPDALVLFTSDHGVFFESHRLTDKGPAMYDEITRVPFIVRWPGHTPAGTVNQHLVSHVDIAATLMDYFGYDVPKTMEGTSALKAFQDPAASAREYVFIEWGRYEVDHDGFGGYQPIRCVCDGRYKLAINLMVTDELYDLQNDPFEMTNLIDSPQHHAVRNQLHDVLLNQMNISRDPFRGYYWGRRSWRPEFPVSWDNAGMTRQRENDGYLPRELDYDTGLTMKSATRPKSGPPAPRMKV